MKKNAVVFSSLVLTACIAMPLTVNADTSSSVDAIMEQLKAFKTQAPKVLTPAPAEDESKEEAEVKSEKKADESPASEATKTVEEIKKKVESAPVVSKKEKMKKEPSRTVGNSAVMMPEPKKARVTKKKSKKRVKKKVMTQDYKDFDKNYRALIDQIINEKPKAQQRSVTPMKQMGKGISGWIYLGRYSDGKWQGNNTLSSGNALPQAGQQYKVQSTHLNLRKSRPQKDGLGKLIKVLRAGEQVSVQKVHRSSRNNYWANITRP